MFPAPTGSHLGAPARRRAPVHPAATAWIALVLLAAPATGAGEAASTGMQAVRDPASGQVTLLEDNRPVLRYNFRTVEPGDALGQVSDANRIYARPRSDYIHPLYGLRGEVLTRDWSPDHPHHRGIYWAWPEVGYGTERGDLHALQRVFARPQGDVRLQGGADAKSASVEADSLWLWEDRVPIVRETALIRAHRATPQGRIVDLEFRFLALTEGITLARRDTRLYGGLNVRLATPAGQAIAVHTDPEGAVPRRAWSDLGGAFQGTNVSGLLILQHYRNPGYPGDWVQYPELSWCQPTFPTAGTRYPLPTNAPLTLRYRLWIHEGPAPSPAEASRLWDDYHRPSTPTLLRIESP